MKDNEIILLFFMICVSFGMSFAAIWIPSWLQRRKILKQWKKEDEKK
jgi:hypothetical protein